MLSGETGVRDFLERPRDPLLNPARGRRQPRTEPDPGEARHRYNEHLFPKVAEPQSRVPDYGKEDVGRSSLREVMYVNHLTGERATLGELWDRHNTAKAAEEVALAALAKEAATANLSPVVSGPDELGRHVGGVTLAGVDVSEAPLAEVHQFPGGQPTLPQHANSAAGA